MICDFVSDPARIPGRDPARTSQPTVFFMLFVFHVISDFLIYIAVIADVMDCNYHRRVGGKLDVF